MSFVISHLVSDNHEFAKLSAPPVIAATHLPVTTKITQPRGPKLTRVRQPGGDHRAQRHGTESARATLKPGNALGIMHVACTLEQAAQPAASDVLYGTLRRTARLLSCMNSTRNRRLNPRTVGSAASVPWGRNGPSRLSGSDMSEWRRSPLSFVQNLPRMTHCRGRTTSQRVDQRDPEIASRSSNDCSTRATTLHRHVAESFPRPGIFAAANVRLPDHGRQTHASGDILLATDHRTPSLADVESPPRLARQSLARLPTRAPYAASSSSVVATVAAFVATSGLALP